jgi:hypothetical protein
MVNPITWESCSICQNILDGKPIRGTHDGLVTLSKRCYHVYHKTCIEDWLEKGKRTCPNCNLQHFSICEVILNPENTRQYQRWLADPGVYTYEQAFQEEYEGRSSQDVGIEADHITRPIDLRGLERREHLTEDEITQFYDEINEVIDRLGPDSTQEQIDKARRELVGAERMIIDAIAERCARQDAQLAANGEQLAHELLLGQYDRKVGVLRRKINEKGRELDELPAAEKNYDLRRELIDVSRRLTNLSQEFTVNGRTNDRSLEESRELLNLVDADLDAFIEGQPEHIKEILRYPIEVQDPQNNDEPWYHNTATVIASLVACIFSVLSVRKYFWGNRNVCQNTNG